MSKKPRIILWDIETLPNLKEVLKVYPGLSAYPGLTLKATQTSIICVGWKELDKKKINCINAWDFKRWRKDMNDDYDVCKAAHEVLKDADLIVTHNGKRFDWKHLQTRLMIHNLPTLHRIPHIDTCAEAKRNLLSFNNRLNTLGESLTQTKKLEHEGWPLWVKVWEKDPKAMKLMTRYCKQDVNVLEKLFKRLRPLMTAIPNYNMWCDPLGKSCPNCGNPNMVKNGFRASKSARFIIYRCKECGTCAQTKIEGVSKPLKTW